MSALMQGGDSAEAYLALIEVAVAAGARNARDLPGCFEHQLDATWWMAARTRCWVPQRHRCPDMAASICASVGRGVARSRATAPMICPLWQ